MYTGGWDNAQKQELAKERQQKKKLTGRGQRMQWMLQHGGSVKRPSEGHCEKSFSKRKNDNANRKKKTYSSSKNCPNVLPF